MPYKLDKINQRILYELDQNCRISDAQLAKKVKRSRESVRNRIKKLVDDGIIEGFLAATNPSKVGYTFFKLYFQLANIPEERKRFYEYFKKLSGLYWFGGNDGVWDFHTTMYAKNLEEINKIKNKIFHDFKHLIIKRDVGVLLNVRQFPKRWFIGKVKERTAPSIFAGEIEWNKMDELDKNILGNLAHNGRISLVELSKKVNSTVDVVRNRMKKLEEKRIIIQYRISVNYTKLGYEMFKAFLYFYHLSEQDEKKLVEYVAQQPQVVYLIRQLSAWDVELEMLCKNYEEFTKIINDLREEFSDILRNYEFCLMREDIWHFGEKDIFEEV
jgi:DNA-binding Lrp family transcriptional regulator